MSLPDEVLILSGELPAEAVDAVRARFPCHGPFGPEALDGFLDRDGCRIAGMATSGKTRLDAAMLDRMPALQVVSCFSAGADYIDAAALAARGIPLATTGAVLADDVADLAIALMLMARRRLVAADAHARYGAWMAEPFQLGQAVRGCRLGLLGFGNIGQEVARRGVAMRMQPRYCARRPRPGAEPPFHATPLALARDSDVLVVACPGGSANRHLVSAEVIDALGPGGTLVNVARGEIVDQAALTRALADGRLGCAGLDVLADEPEVPAALAGLPNLVLSPHIGSGTVQTRRAMGDAMLRALEQVLPRQAPSFSLAAAAAPGR